MARLISAAVRAHTRLTSKLLSTRPRVMVSQNWAGVSWAALTTREHRGISTTRLTRVTVTPRLTPNPGMARRDGFFAFMKGLPYFS